MKFVFLSFLLALIELNFSYNRLCDITIDIISDEPLQETNLQVDRIGLSKSLKKLHLSHCESSIWPSELRFFNSLEYLDLSHNNISEIADGKIGLLMVLEVLNLSNNRLASFPKDLYSLPLKVISMSVCLNVCLFVYLSVCLSIRLSIRLSICLPACLSICLSVCLFVYLYVCLSVFLHNYFFLR